MLFFFIQIFSNVIYFLRIFLLDSITGLGSIRNFKFISGEKKRSYFIIILIYERRGPVLLLFLFCFSFSFVLSLFLFFLLFFFLCFYFHYLSLLSLSQGNIGFDPTSLLSVLRRSAIFASKASALSFQNIYFCMFRLSFLFFVKKMLSLTQDFSFIYFLFSWSLWLSILRVLDRKSTRLNSSHAQ